MMGCGSDDSLVSWSAEPTWCGSELSFWGCSVPRGGVGDSGCGWSMFPWAHSPGGWMSTGLRLNIYSVAGRGREPPGHLMPLRGHDTWSPAFIKAPSQSTFPGPPPQSFVIVGCIVSGFSHCTSWRRARREGSPLSHPRLLSEPTAAACGWLTGKPFRGQVFVSFNRPTGGFPFRDVWTTPQLRGSVRAWVSSLSLHVPIWGRRGLGPL